MIIDDRGTQQWAIFWIAVVLVVTLGCITIWVYQFAHALSCVHEARAETAKARAKEVEANAALIQRRYELALLERAPALDSVDLEIPMERVNKLAQERVEMLIRTLRVRVDAKVDV